METYCLRTHVNVPERPCQKCVCILNRHRPGLPSGSSCCRCGQRLAPPIPGRRLCDVPSSTGFNAGNGQARPRPLRHTRGLSPPPEGPGDVPGSPALLRQWPRLFCRARLWPARVSVHSPKALRATRAWGPGLAPPLNQPEAHRQASISPLTKGCGADRCHRPESGRERGAARDLLSSLPERPSPDRPPRRRPRSPPPGSLPDLPALTALPLASPARSPPHPLLRLCCRPHRARG